MLCILLLLAGYAQQKKQPLTNVEKLPPDLQQLYKNKVLPDPLTLQVLYTDSAEFTNWCKQNAVSAVIRNDLHIAKITLSTAAAFEKLLSNSAVLFVAQQQIAKEETLLSRFDLSTNHITKTHGAFPQATGSGQNISLKENIFDSTDIDFTKRWFSTTYRSPTRSDHATFMATMSAGGGNSWHLGKGVAYKAGITGASFASLVPEPMAYYRQNNISVQNHSYGTGIENYYGADAAAYDATTWQEPGLLHVFSAGNSGTQTSTAGNYAGINAYANITGSFKMSKNSICVGATDSFLNLEAPSSRGPAYDGRIKPELVAFGEDGSSGAAALVSGAALLLQQVYKMQTGLAMPAALAKAVLINGATDIDTPGPDFASGFGSLNTYDAMKHIIENKYVLNTIPAGGEYTFSIAVPANTSRLNLTLCYTDTPATANASRALTNDLDITITNGSGQTWQPWVLTTAAHKDSLALPARRGRDSINNCEQVTLEAPVAGTYTIRVRSVKQLTSRQEFAIAWQATAANSFEFTHPNKNNAVTAGQRGLVRWQSSYAAGTTGQLQYQLNNGNWVTAGSNIALNKQLYVWDTPDSIATLRYRMITGLQTYLSDTCVLSKRLPVFVGYNCPDSMLIYWNKIPQANAYQVYQLKDSFIQPIKIITDTFFTSAVNGLASRQFAVEPLISNRAAIKSYTFDFSSQGVACYFTALTVSPFGNGLRAEGTLGTAFGLKQVVIQRLEQQVFVDKTATVVSPASLQMVYDDLQPLRGNNTYRIKIILNNGLIYYSQPETAFWFEPNNFFVYPNPAGRQQTVICISSETEPVQAVLYDMAGRPCMRSTLYNGNNPLPVKQLPAGTYILVLRNAAQITERHKIILQ